MLYLSPHSLPIFSKSLLIFKCDLTRITIDRKYEYGLSTHSRLSDQFGNGYRKYDSLKNSTFNISDYKNIIEIYLSNYKITPKVKNK